LHDQFKSLKQIALEKSSNKDLQGYIKDKINNKDISEQCKKDNESKYKQILI
jgi:hypothetical protein